MKLVRDMIPELYQGHEYHAACHREQAILLRLKLIEEAGEVVGARNHQELIEELGDVLEVVTAIAHHAGINAQTIDDHRATKRDRLGGFGAGWVMVTFEEES